MALEETSAALVISADDTRGGEALVDPVEVDVDPDPPQPASNTVGASAHSMIAATRTTACCLNAIGFA
jgi:hypothetical protein